MEQFSVEKEFNLGTRFASGTVLPALGQSTSNKGRCLPRPFKFCVDCQRLLAGAGEGNYPDRRKWVDAETLLPLLRHSLPRRQCMHRTEIRSFGALQPAVLEHQVGMARYPNKPIWGWIDHGREVH